MCVKGAAHATFPDEDEDGTLAEAWDDYGACVDHEVFKQVGRGAAHHTAHHHDASGWDDYGVCVCVCVDNEVFRQVTVGRG